VKVEFFSRFFTMLSWLSWGGCTWLSSFNTYKSLLSFSTSCLSSSFSWATRSSQDSTNTCSILDWLAWEQQGLVQANSLLTSEHVHVGVRGCKNFTDETKTSWAISS
jgi:hypothetical protein